MSTRAGSTRTIAVVSAGLGKPSSTRLLAERLTAATLEALRARRDDATVEVVDLRPHARDLADNLLTGFASRSLRTAVDTVSGADGLIAGTARHSLALDHALRPLFACFRAVPVPTGVFAPSEDRAGGDSTGLGLAGRIERAGGELADLVTGRPTATGPVDPFADPAASFEELLRRDRRLQSPAVAGTATPAGALARGGSAGRGVSRIRTRPRTAAAPAGTASRAAAMGTARTVASTPAVNAPRACAAISTPSRNENAVPREAWGSRCPITTPAGTVRTSIAPAARKPTRTSGNGLSTRKTRPATAAITALVRQTNRTSSRCRPAEGRKKLVTTAAAGATVASRPAPVGPMSRWSA